MTEYVFSIAKDFSKFPGPRYKDQGPHSGETLRGLLARKLKDYQGRFIIDLDGTVGYGSSFLDEAFGGLVRNGEFEPAWLVSTLEFRSKLDPTYVQEILESITHAQPA